MALVAMGALVGAGCSRTPPEPAPPSIEAASIAPSTATAGKSAPPTSDALARPSSPTTDSNAAPGCPSDPEGNGHLPTAQVAFPDAPGRPKVDVEIAKTPHDIERGLMYRRTMPEDHGMLFRLDERREHIFWMHNTCISLDMLFVEDDGRIVGIVENAAPLTDTSRTVGKPSSWVLEVNGGYVARHGVKAGQKLGIPPAAR